MDTRYDFHTLPEKDARVDPRFAGRDWASSMNDFCWRSNEPSTNYDREVSTLLPSSHEVPQNWDRYTGDINDYRPGIQRRKVSQLLTSTYPLIPLSEPFRSSSDSLDLFNSTQNNLSQMQDANSRMNIESTRKYLKKETCMTISSTSTTCSNIERNSVLTSETISLVTQVLQGRESYNEAHNVYQDEQTSMHCDSEWYTLDSANINSIPSLSWCQGIGTHNSSMNQPAVSPQYQDAHIGDLRPRSEMYYNPYGGQTLPQDTTVQNYSSVDRSNDIEPYKYIPAVSEIQSYPFADSGLSHQEPTSYEQGINVSRPWEHNGTSYSCLIADPSLPNQHHNYNGAKNGISRPWEHGGMSYSNGNAYSSLGNRNHIYNGTKRGIGRPLEFNGSSYFNSNPNMFIPKQQYNYIGTQSDNFGGPMDHDGLNYSGLNENSSAFNQLKNYHNEGNDIGKPMEFNASGYSNFNANVFIPKLEHNYIRTQIDSGSPLDHNGLHYSNFNSISPIPNQDHSYNGAQNDIANPLDHDVKGLHYSNFNSNLPIPNQRHSCNGEQNDITSSLNRVGFQHSILNSNLPISNQHHSYNGAQNDITSSLNRDGLQHSNLNSNLPIPNQHHSCNGAQNGIANPLDHDVKGLHYSNLNSNLPIPNQRHSCYGAQNDITSSLNRIGFQHSILNSNLPIPNQHHSCNGAQNDITSSLNRVGLQHSNLNSNLPIPNQHHSCSGAQNDIANPLDQNGLHYSNFNSISPIPNQDHSYNGAQNDNFGGPMDHDGLNYSGLNENSSAFNQLKNYHNEGNDIANPLDQNGLHYSNFNSISPIPNQNHCSNGAQNDITSSLEHGDLHYSNHNADLSVPSDHHNCNDWKNEALPKKFETPCLVEVERNVFSRYLWAYTPAGQAYRIDCLKNIPELSEQPIDMEVQLVAAVLHSKITRFEIECGICLPKSLDLSLEDSFSELLAMEVSKVEDWASKKNPFLKHDLLFLENEFWLSELNRGIRQYMHTDPEVVETCLDELLKRDISYSNIFRQPETLRSLRKVIKLENNPLCNKATKLFENLKEINNRCRKGALSDSFIKKISNEQNQEKTNTFEWLFLRDTSSSKTDRKNTNKPKKNSSLEKEEKKSQTTPISGSPLVNANNSSQYSLPEMMVGTIDFSLSSGETLTNVNLNCNESRTASSNEPFEESDFAWDSTVTKEDPAHNKLKKSIETSGSACEQFEETDFIWDNTVRKEESHLYRKPETHTESSETAQCVGINKDLEFSIKSGLREIQSDELEQQLLNKVAPISPCSSPRLEICTSPLESN